MCHSQMSQLFLVGSFRLTLGADISKELYWGGNEDKIHLMLTKKIHEYSIFTIL